MTIAEALRLVGEEEVREKTTRGVRNKTTREIACRLLKAGSDPAFVQAMTKLGHSEIKALQAKLP